MAFEDWLMQRLRAGGFGLGAGGPLPQRPGPPPDSRALQAIAGSLYHAPRAPVAPPAMVGPMAPPRPIAHPSSAEGDGLNPAQIEIVARMAQIQALLDQQAAGIGPPDQSPTNDAIAGTLHHAMRGLNQAPFPPQAPPVPPGMAVSPPVSNTPDPFTDPASTLYQSVQAAIAQGMPPQEALAYALEVAQPGDPILDATVGAVPGYVANVGEQRSLADLALALVPDPVETAVTEPQHQVALLVARDAYQTAKTGQESSLARLLPDSPVADWSKDEANRQAIVDAYEKGYTRTNEKGETIETIPPGDEAVLALYEDSLGSGFTGFVNRMAFGTATDPLAALPGIGRFGGGLTHAGEAIRAAENASDVARTAGSALAATGRVVEGAARLPDVPGEALVAGATRAGQGVRRLPGVRDVLAPSARAAEEATRVAQRRAADLFGKSEQALELRGATPFPNLPAAEPSAPFVRTSLDEPVTTPGDITPFGEPVLPDEDLGYLNPRPDGQRAVDHVAYVVGPQNPDRAREFWRAYQGRAKSFMADQAKINRSKGPLPRRPDGSTVEDYRTVALEVEHFAKDVTPLYRQAFGADPPAYKPRVPSEGRTLPVVERDPTGTVLNEDVVRKTKMQGDDLNHLIELAVTTPDNLLATDLRHWMRKQDGNDAVRMLGNRLKEARRILWGNDSILSGKEEIRRRAAAQTTPFPETTPFPTDPVGSAGARRGFAGETDADGTITDRSGRVRIRPSRESARSAGASSDIIHLTVEVLEDGTWVRSADFQGYAADARSLTEQAIARADDIVKNLPDATPSVRNPLTDETTPFPDRLTDETTPFSEPPPNLGGARPARPILSWTTRNADPGISPPDPGGLGGMARRASEQGDIDPDALNALLAPVKVGGKWKGKGKDAVLEGAETKRFIDVYAGFLREGMGLDEAKRATFEAIGETATGPAKQGRWRLLSRYDGFTAGVREHIMFNPIRGPLGMMVDTLGNTWTAITSGNIEAAVNIYRPSTILAAWRDVRDGTTRTLAQHTPTGRLVDRLGLPQPKGLGVEEGMAGREEVERFGETALHRFVAGKTGVERLGDLTGALATKAIRDARAAMDTTFRWSIYGTELAKNLPTQRDAFLRAVDDLGARRGIDTEDMIDGLGDEFDVRDVRAWAARSGFRPGDVDQLGRQWRRGLNDLDRAATKEMKRLGFDFSATTKADEVMRRLFLFHFWQTRAAPLYLANAVKNPALAGAYSRMAEEMKTQCERRGGGMCGYLELAADVPGFAFFFNPLAIVSSTLISLEPEQWTDPDATMLDRVVDRVPAMFNPLLQTATVVLGWSGKDQFDPVASYTARKTVGAAINYAVAHDWPGAKAIFPDRPDAFYDEWLTKILSAANDKLADWTPVGRERTFVDPNANDNLMVQSRIRDLVMEEHGLTLEANPRIEDWPEEARADLDAAMVAWQTGDGTNEIANQAIRDYTSGNLVRRGLGSTVIPGGIRMRSESRDELMATRDAGGPNADAARNLLQIAEAPTPEATGVEIAQPGYRAIGADLDDPLKVGKGANTAYGNVRYGENPQAVFVGGKLIPAAEIAAMSPEERKLLADTWLAERNLTDARGAYLDTRTAYVADNPDLAAYDAWADQMRTGGKAAIDELARTNPTYGRYLSNLPEEVKRDEERYEMAALSTDAYFAAREERGGVFDPLPVEAGAPSLPPMPGDGGSGQKPPGPKDLGQQILDGMMAYQTDVLLFDQTLKTLTGNPNASWDLINPMLKTSYARDLADMGIHPPSEPGVVAAYRRWVAAQPPGSDTSINAYVAWAEKNKKR